MNKELERLETLIPNELLGKIVIANCQSASAPRHPFPAFLKDTASHIKRQGLRVTVGQIRQITSKLIWIKKLNAKRYQIEIDFHDWQEIDIDYRNLLFWHEVAKIQQHSVDSQRWQLVVFATGLVMSMFEINSQQVLLLAIYLLLTLVAGWQLYQNHRGESYLRAATQADQGAIILAQQFGYPLPKAYRSLRGGIKILLKRSPKNLLAKQYQTRCQVLEINAIKQRQKVAIFSKLQIKPKT